MNPVIKKNIETNAQLKTMSDYALMLEHMSGYTKKAAKQEAMEASEEIGENTLFEKLLNRNRELFKTGDVVFQ